MSLLKRIRLIHNRPDLPLSAGCVLLLLASWASPLKAQKRPLTAKDSASWRDIDGQTLSRDGHYLAYGVFPEEGDGEVVVRDLKTGREWRGNAGQLPPPPVEDPTADVPPPPRNIRLVFMGNSKTLLFLAYPKHDAVERAKKDKQFRAQEELVILSLVAGADLSSSSPVRIPDVKNFELPSEGNGFVAYQKYGTAPASRAEATAAEPSDDSGEEDAQARGRGAAGGTSNDAEFGSPVELRKLADGSEREFAYVLEYQLTKDAGSLAYSVASTKAETDGVYVVATSGGEPRTLIASKGRFEHLTWDDKLDELAFIGNPGDTDNGKKPPYALYLWKISEPKAVEAVSTSTPTFRAGFVISNHAMLKFSPDGTRLFFGAAPPPPPVHATAIDQDKPSFDLWNYKDDYIQPAQKVRATADRNRSFRAVYVIPEHKLLQIADESMQEIVPNEAGRYALGTNDKQYRPMLDYGDRYQDYFLVDLEDGHRTPLVKKSESTLRWSGDGRYATTFDGKDWIAIALPSGRDVNLTSKLPVKFWNEENDTPSTPPPYGFAGWTKDDKYLLLYDRFDVWQVAPDGSSAVNLTAGLGRKEHLEFRYVKLDPDEKTIDPAKPILLRAENIVTRESGFYTAKINSPEALHELLMTPTDVNTPIKAKDADVYVFAEQSFSQFPDLLITDASFHQPRKVTDVNPQQAGLLWGSDEMVNFTNIDGVPLQGILYKPANFDARKQYPMIVYLYEKLSQNLNHFVDPKPMDSINISYYVSNGYLVFTPDIVYTKGYPGQSALKCVMAGVNAVTARGFVDEKNIGIQGHSWGGYQIAYMVTQTNRFKAAEDGAPVVNMISAYDGIRWGPGRPRQFQYEKTQSRIGGTPWEYPLRFIENSPIFMADKIQTPLLIIHNDADDAVPWYQGIEFFLALRRLGKEAYMFTYNGEPHHLRRRANQEDYAARMAQFFDYELKAGPKPKWMTDGIPYLHTAEQVAVDTP